MKKKKKKKKKKKEKTSLEKEGGHNTSGPEEVELEGLKKGWQALITAMDPQHRVQANGHQVNSGYGSTWIKQRLWEWQTRHHFFLLIFNAAETCQAAGNMG